MVEEKAAENGQLAMGWKRFVGFMRDKGHNIDIVTKCVTPSSASHTLADSHVLSRLSRGVACLWPAVISCGLSVSAACVLQSAVPGLSRGGVQCQVGAAEERVQGQRGGHEETR